MRLPLLNGWIPGSWSGGLAAGLAVALALGGPIAAPAQTIPTGGVPLVSGDVATTGSFYSNNVAAGPIATRSIVSVTGRSFATAARVATVRPADEFYRSAITGNSTRAVANGDIVLLRFFLRAIETTDESGQATAQVYVEGPAPEYRKSISQQISAGLEWVEYFIPFAVDGSYASGQLGIKFGFGTASRPQVLELGGVEVLWYGTSRTLAEMPRTSFQYLGRDAAAPWRAEAAARIDRHRKGDFSVQVVSSAGTSVPGASVRVRQRRHAFEIGTAFVGSRVLNQTDANNAVYREKLLELFNAGSTENDLKWQPWIGEWGASFSRSIALGALQWAQAQGLRLRGHVLVWPSTRNMPSSLTAKINASDPTIPGTILAHIDDIVAATSQYLGEWDVLNEPYDNHDVMDRYGNQHMIEWFQRARAKHPTAELYINDYAILSGGGLNVAKQDAYENTIRYIRNGGGPLTGIGFQGHFSGSPTGIPRIWEILQRYATAFPDLKFRITEFDVSTDDEALQADFTRDLLTIAMSHPQMQGVQFWGFWEGAHWRKTAALYRQNWDEKPNGAALRNLFYRDWWTDVATKSSAAGRVRGRAFLGSYQVEATYGGVTVSRPFELPLGGAEVTVTLPVPAGVPAIVSAPAGTTVTVGSPVTLSVGVSGSGPLALQWKRNGVDVAGATGTMLTLPQAQAGDAGVYTVVVSGPGGAVVSAGAVVGVVSSGKISGNGAEVGSNIVHPNGNVYDQVLMTGPVVTVQADPGQITRTSYIDLSDDIVQVEFSGAGTLTISLANATGPAAPLSYNQPSVAYMKGHATLTIAGADESTNVSVFTVGTRTAVNQALFRSDTVYDGVADLALVSIRSDTGRFGGVRCANAEFFSTGGTTGLFAPGVDFLGPVYVHNVSARDDATPVLLTGTIVVGSLGITGGDMTQANGHAVQVGAATMIQMRAGETSHGVAQPARANRAIYERDGQDVTAALVANP